MPAGVTADKVRIRQADFIRALIGIVQTVLLETVAVVVLHLTGLSINTMAPGAWRS